MSAGSRVREFLARHPSGTVIELGTGLNSRFERTGNGSAHWIDLDLPDTIELRRRFFADTDRRQMAVVRAQLVSGWVTSAGTGACGDGRSRRRTVSSSS
jgi:O-methyltransferase involved in polyketide biosynthesis